MRQRPRLRKVLNRLTVVLLSVTALLWLLIFAATRDTPDYSTWSPETDSRQSAQAVSPPPHTGT